MGILSDLFKSNTPEEKAAAKWQALNEQIKREEASNEDLAWEKKFQDLQTKGLSPSAALTHQISDPQGGGTGKIIPGTGEGSGYQEPSPLDRWKAQIDGMVNSGDPTLQKAGLAMISQYQQRKTAPPTKGETDPTSFREWQLAKQYDGYTGSYQDWKQLNKASGTTVNVGGEDKFKSSDVVFDGQGKRVNVPVGMNKSDAPADWTFGQQATSEEAQQIGTTESSIANLERLRDIVVAGDGDVSGLEGWLAKARTGGDLLPAALDTVLGFAGQDLTENQIEAISLTTTLGNQLLDAIRGAQVGPEEQKIFEKQLPMPGQNPKTFLANMITTYRNLDQLADRKAEVRGTPRRAGDRKKFTEFEFGGNKYRITPGGKIQVGRAK